MRTYTTEEVEKMLETQRWNCWVAAKNAKIQDKDALVAILNAPNPGEFTYYKQQDEKLDKSQKEMKLKTANFTLIATYNGELTPKEAHVKMIQALEKLDK